MEILSSIGHFLLIAFTFILIFSVLIIIHELGHYFVARLGKVKVEEFGFGLPPKLFWKKTKIITKMKMENGKVKTFTDDMTWSLNAIPFGGFVRMTGEDSDKEAQNDPRAFCNRPLIIRMLVTLAGITMNFILAFFLFAFVAWIGYTPIVDPNLVNHPKFQIYFEDGHVEKWVEQGFYAKGSDGVFIGALDPEGPAVKAGMLPGDKIVSINGTGVEDLDSFRSIQEKIFSGDALEYSVLRLSPEERKEENILLQITPEKDTDGVMRIGVILFPEYYYPISEVEVAFTDIPKDAYITSRRFVVLSVDMVKTLFVSTLGQIFQGEKPEIPEGVGGPVAIAQTTKTLVEIGDFSKIIQFAAVLSLSLAVINLVPFPALDGGRFFFQVLEGLFYLLLLPFNFRAKKGSKIPHRIPQKWETPLHIAGYMLLLLFIVVVTYKDIVRIISG